jgi:phage tail-like protein
MADQNADATVDPYPACNFKIMIGGETVANFLEWSGAEIEVATAEWREGGQPGAVRQIPILTSYADTTFRMGMTSSTVLWDWFLSTTRGEVKRQNVSVVLLNPAGTGPVLQWNLDRAFPKKWKGAVLRSNACEIAIEEVVLAYEALGRTS